MRTDTPLAPITCDSYFPDTPDIGYERQRENHFTGHQGLSEEGESRATAFGGTWSATWICNGGMTADDQQPGLDRTGGVTPVAAIGQA